MRRIGRTHAQAADVGAGRRHVIARSPGQRLQQAPSPPSACCPRGILVAFPFRSSLLGPPASQRVTTAPKARCLIQPPAPPPRRRRQVRCRLIRTAPQVPHAHTARAVGRHGVMPLHVCRPAASGMLGRGLAPPGPGPALGHLAPRAHLHPHARTRTDSGDRGGVAAEGCETRARDEIEGPERLVVAGTDDEALGHGRTPPCVTVLCHSRPPLRHAGAVSLKPKDAPTPARGTDLMRRAAATSSTRSVSSAHKASTR